MNQDNSIGAVILAAGSSSRLGRPKQLLEIGGIPLLARTVSAIHATGGVDPVVVVLGAAAEEISGRLAALETVDTAEFVTFGDWQLGMGSSLAFGVDYMLRLRPELRHLIISVCDQPFLDAEHVNKLLAGCLKHPRHIIASAYADTLGPPVVFPRCFFHELVEGSGKGGAKVTILRHMEMVVPIEFPQGGIDLDTIGDLESFYSISGGNFPL